MRDGIMRLLLPTAREAGIPRMARTDVCKHLRRYVMGKDLLACSAILRRWQYPSCLRVRGLAERLHAPYRMRKRRVTTASFLGTGHVER